VPESSTHTSIKARVDHVTHQGRTEDLKAARGGSVAGSAGASGLEEGHWLCPIEDRRRLDSTREGMLEGFSLGNYLLLVDFTARLYREGKARGASPGHAPRAESRSAAPWTKRTISTRAGVVRLITTCCLNFSIRQARKPGADQLTHPRVGRRESERLAGLREPPVSGRGRHLIVVVGRLVQNVAPSRRGDDQFEHRLSAPGPAGACPARRGCRL